MNVKGDLIEVTVTLEGEEAVELSEFLNGVHQLHPAPDDHVSARLRTQLDALIEEDS